MGQGARMMPLVVKVARYDNSRRVGRVMHVLRVQMPSYWTQHQANVVIDDYLARLRKRWAKHGMRGYPVLWDIFYPPKGRR